MADVIMTVEGKNVEDFRKNLLKWYDRHRRAMQWRALPAQKPNPYHVWMSEIMLQQTTVQAVGPYFMKFIEKWPDIHALASARSEDIMEAWAGLGYYTRARNLHKCAVHVAERLGGSFPEEAAELKKLPGIGDYTCEAVAAIAFNRPANVVDGNVERVMARIFAVTEPMPDCKPRLKDLAGQTAAGEKKRPGDYAQSLMDLGATICTPTSPKCMLCPVIDFCSARAKGIEASLPARKPKAARPQKHGYVYWITDGQGSVLFERRAEKGMLAGTIGLPTSEWVEKATEKTHLPLKLTRGGKAVVGPPWERTAVSVKHTFTHFDLELSGYAACVAQGKALEAMGGYFWVPGDRAKSLGLPTVFKKALRQFI